MAETKWKIEATPDRDYRLLSPDGEVGEVFSFGEQAHIITKAQNCWAAFISIDGRFSGFVHRIAEPGSLEQIGQPQACDIDQLAEPFEFEPEPASSTGPAVTH